MADNGLLMSIAFESNLATIRHYGSDQSTRTTGSFTPTAGRLLVVCVDTQNGLGQLNDTTGTMAISNTHAGSWSWTILGNSSNATYDPNGATYYGRVHLAYAIVPASPGSGTITLTFNGGGGSVNKPRNTVIVDVLEFSGVDTASPVIQSKLGRAGVATSNTVTLDTTPITSSTVVSFVGVSYDTDHTDTTQPTGHTEISEYDTGNPDFNHSFCSSYDQSAPSASLNYTNFPTSTYGSAIIGLELKNFNKGIPPGF